MKKIIYLSGILAIVGIFFALPAFAANNATSTLAGGNWSNTATWVGGVVPGDGYTVTIMGPVVIDQNIGTLGNGIGTITLFATSTASLSVNSSSPRTIIFNSTSTAPTGIYVNGAVYPACAGALTLVGNASNTITMEPGDGVSPIYIYDITFFAASSLSIKWADIYDLGSNVSTTYDGIYENNGFAGPTDIENDRFTSPYIFLLNTTGNITFKNNYITGERGTPLIETFNNQGTADYENNVEVNPTVNKTWFLQNVYSPNAFVFKNNAVMGTATSSMQLFTGATIGDQNFVDNLDYSSTTGFTISNFPTAVTMNNTTGAALESSTVSEGAIQAVSTGQCATGTTFSDDINIVNPNITQSQGEFETGNLTSQCTFANDIVDWTAASTTQGNYAGDGFFEWGTTNSDIYNHDDIIYAPGTSNYGSTYDQPGQGQAIVNAEGGGDMINGSIDKNILVTGALYGIGSIATNGAFITMASDSVGVGVHHNDIFGNAVTSTPVGGGGNLVMSLAYPFPTTSTTNVVTSSILHPSSFYGDITANPNFVDSSRNIEKYDANVLHGPGTVADYFAKLSCQSGWGCVNTLPSNPIQQLHDWIWAGFAPTNPALFQAASDGGTIGAVPYQFLADVNVYATMYVYSTTYMY